MSSVLWGLVAGGTWAGCTLLVLWHVRTGLVRDEELIELIERKVRRELANEKLRDWQAIAAQKDASLAAAERAGERAARSVLRDAWRSEVREGGCDEHRASSTRATDIDAHTHS